MPTDNPKISLYVPQKIYDRFKEFQEEQQLSMSQAGIVILAEYFGLEETIKEITEGTTIGGVTLDSFKEVENRVNKLEIELSKSIYFEIALLHEKIEAIRESNKEQAKRKHKSNEIGSVVTSEGINPKNAIKTELKIVEHKNIKSSSLKDNKIKNSESQLNLLGEPQEIKPLPATFLSEKRFGLGKDTLASYKRKHTLEELSKWTKEKDPDNITWILALDNKGYIPKDKLSSELLSKLQSWIRENRK